MHPAHFLQTDAWKRFQEAQGNQTFEASTERWHWLAVLETGKFPRLYCPYGPTLASPTDLADAVTALKQQAAAVGAHYVRIEPQIAGTDYSQASDSAHAITQLTSELTSAQAVRAPHSMQPEHTWHIPLIGDELDVLKNFSKTTRRYWLHDNSALGLSFRTSYNPEEIQIFLDAIHEVAARTGMRPHSDSYFSLQAKTLMPNKNACLLVAEVDGKPAATIIAFDSATTRSYAHAAAHYEFHKLQVSTLVVAYGIIEAQKIGKSYFDMYGIAPPDQPNHPWSGFTRFKQSFGGFAVSYVGTWDIPVKTQWYRAYRAASQASTLRRQAQKKLHTLRSAK